MSVINILGAKIKRRLRAIKRFLNTAGQKKYLNFNRYWVQRVQVKSVPKRYEYFKDLCTNKRVLHFGCTDWPIFDPQRNLHIQLSKHARVLHGFDIDLDGIENLKRYVDQEYFSRFNQIPELHYDICLIPETIEHVDNVSLFLQNVSLINADTFVITAPNCFSRENISRNFWGKNEFVEVVHPDHNCWYSPYTLKNQIEKYTKLKVVEVILLEKDTMICCIAKSRF